MESESILSWNVTNWVTVVLMAAIGAAICGVLIKVVTKYRSGNDD